MGAQTRDKITFPRDSLIDGKSAGRKEKQMIVENTLTVAELKRQLAGWSDDTKIDFGCTLTGTPLVFYRFKKRGEKSLQIELNEHVASEASTHRQRRSNF